MTQKLPQQRILIPSLIYSLIHLFREYILCADYGLGTVPSAGAPAQQGRHNPCLCSSESKPREHMPCGYHVPGPVPCAPPCKVHLHSPRIRGDIISLFQTGKWHTEAKGWVRDPELLSCRELGGPSPWRNRTPGSPGPCSSRSCTTPEPRTSPGHRGGIRAAAAGRCQAPHRSHSGLCPPSQGSPQAVLVMSAPGRERGAWG